MSFGFSAGDFFLLIQLAKATYKSCVEAGIEYNEIAREIRSLHGVLKPLRDEANKPDSGLFRQDQGSAVELVKAIDGCRHILEDMQILLGKYEGLSTTGEAVSAPKKLWHRFRFSTKIEQLGAVRGKLIAYTSTISVLLDGVQLRATGRVVEKLDVVSWQMTEGFESLKKAILGMAVKARAEQRNGSTMSLLSLSTYAEDDKEVWHEFRRELVALGFRSKALDRHKDLLQAYMLKLDQSGLLDEVKDSSGQNTSKSWYKKHAFLETVSSLPGLQPINEEESTPQLPGSPPRPPDYGIDNKSKPVQLPGPSQSDELKQYDSELPSASGPPSQEKAHESLSKDKSFAASSDAPLVDLPWPTDSDESEKETSGLKRPRRVRKLRRSDPKVSDADSVDVSSDSSGFNQLRRVHTKRKPEDRIPTADRNNSAPEVATNSASEATKSPSQSKDEQGNNFDIDISPSERTGNHNADTLELQAAKIGTGARLEPISEAQSGDMSNRDHSNPSSNFDKPSPKTVHGPVPGDLASEADVPQARHAETQNTGEVGDIAQNYEIPENRRKRDVTNWLDRVALDTKSHNLKTDVTYQRASKIQESPSKVLPGVAPQSFKSGKPIDQPALLRPSFSQRRSDPNPNSRFGKGTRAQFQERSKPQTGKSSSTSGVGAVALGLAGLSMILGMRKARDARRGRGYISDTESYYDTYDSITTDSEDDENFSRGFKLKPTGHSSNRSSARSDPLHIMGETSVRKPKPSTRNVRPRESDVSNTGSIGSPVQTDVVEPHVNQKEPQSAIETQSLNDNAEPALDSDTESPAADRIVEEEPLASVESDPRSASATTVKRMDGDKASKIRPERDYEGKSEPKKTLSSSGASDTGNRANGFVAQQVTLPRLTPTISSKSAHATQAANQDDPSSKLGSKITLRRLTPKEIRMERAAREKRIKIEDGSDFVEAIGVIESEEEPRSRKKVVQSIEKDIPNSVIRKALTRSEEEVPSLRMTSRGTEKKMQNSVRSSSGPRAASKQTREAWIRREQRLAEREEAKRVSEGFFSRPRRDGDNSNSESHRRRSNRAYV